jgi:hypothetical protein
MNHTSDSPTAISSPRQQVEHQRPEQRSHGHPEAAPVQPPVAPQRRQAQEPADGHDHDRRQHRLGQVGEQRGQERRRDQDQDGRQERHHLARAAGTLGGRGPRGAA